MLFSQSVTKSSLLDLPAEIKERILLELQHDGVLLDRKQAEAVREELMTERSAAGRRLNRDLFEVGYSYVHFSFHLANASTNASTHL